MDEQSPSEEDGSLCNLLTDPTDSGVSSSVASNDSILKHQAPNIPHFNGLSAEDLMNSSALSNSLQDGLEKTEHLLTTGGHPLGLSSVSLEVRTSGEQLNLLAEGLDSPLGSTGGQSQEELEDKKTSECDDIADDAQVCVKSVQCESISVCV